MFSKKPDPVSSPPQAPRMSGRNSGSTFSVIGADVVIRGNVEASADLHVDGRVIGDLTCASLVTGEASTIEGAISADSARLSGTIIGTVNVRELAVLRSARIEGDVSYETLTIEQGANVNGRFAPQQAGASAFAGADGATPVSLVS